MLGFLVQFKVKMALCQLFNNVFCVCWGNGRIDLLFLMILNKLFVVVEGKQVDESAD